MLRPGGALAVLGMDPHLHQDDWYIYEYFKGVYANDLIRFPSWGQVLDWMSAAGFGRMELRLAEEIVANLNMDLLFWRIRSWLKMPVRSWCC